MANIFNILDFNLRMVSQLFTANGSLIVPSGANWLYVDAVGPGGGGGGGNSTPGGGGGGGGSGRAFTGYRLPVTPGATITVTFGAVGAAGAVNANGGDAGNILISGSLIGGPVYVYGGSGGLGGGATNGGNGGYGGFFEKSGAIGTAGGGVAGNLMAFSTSDSRSGFSSGSSGGGTFQTGGSEASDRGLCIHPFAQLVASSTGNAAGGGGQGGNNTYGQGGVGGSIGGAGASPTMGYGAGGGGGSGNSVGGAGGSGFVRLSWLA